MGAGGTQGCPDMLSHQCLALAIPLIHPTRSAASILGLGRSSNMFMALAPACRTVPNPSTSCWHRDVRFS